MTDTHLWSSATWRASGARPTDRPADRRGWTRSRASRLRGRPPRIARWRGRRTGPRTCPRQAGSAPRPGNTRRARPTPGGSRSSRRSCWPGPGILQTVNGRVFDETNVKRSWVKTVQTSTQKNSLFFSNDRRLRPNIPRPCKRMRLLYVGFCLARVTLLSPTIYLTPTKMTVKKTMRSPCNAVTVETQYRLITNTFNTVLKSRLKFDRRPFCETSPLLHRRPFYYLSVPTKSFVVRFRDEISRMSSSRNVSITIIRCAEKRQKGIRWRHKTRAGLNDEIRVRLSKLQKLIFLCQRF